MRNLATIQKILNVRPIEGADRIEVVDVLGWSVVVDKAENHKVGDLVVYYEIDSFLNANDPRYASFEERFSNWGTKRGMRLRTIKLRKQISQGLVLKADKFDELFGMRGYDEPAKLKFHEGDDVTEVLKIEKWESLSESQSNGGGMGAKTAGATPFPSFIRRTDQERVQNYITELPKHLAETFEATIKLDGSSMTVFRIDQSSPNFKFAWEDIETRLLRKKSKFGRFWYNLLKKVGLNKAPNSLDGVCSRNIQLDTDGDNHFSSYVRDHELLEALENLGRNVAIQGELIAPSIQENFEQVKGFEFYVYDIFDIDKQDYLLPAETQEILGLIGLKSVPVLDPVFSLIQLLKTDGSDVRALVEAILAYAEGPGMNPGVKREGVVFKSNSTPFSFKAISNSYLLAKAKKEAKQEAEEAKVVA